MRNRKRNNSAGDLFAYRILVQSLIFYLLGFAMISQSAISASSDESSKNPMAGISTNSNSLLSGDVAPAGRQHHATADRMFWQTTSDYSLLAAQENILTTERIAMISKPHEGAIIQLKQTKSSVTSMTAAAWSPDGRTMATAGGALPVIVWDGGLLSVVKELSQGENGGGENHIAFSQDGRYLASGLRTVNVWETATWQPHATLIAPHVKLGTPQGIGIESLGFSPDSKLLVVAYAGIKSVVIAYQVQDGKIAWSHEPLRTIGGPRITTPIVFTPDGALVIFGTGERGSTPEGDPQRLSRVLFLDARTGALRKSIDRVHMDSPTALAISRDGKRIATGTSTGVTDQTGNIKTNRPTVFENKDPIRLWDVETGKLISELPIPSRVWALAFSRDGKYLISSRSDIRKHMTVAVWDVNSGKLGQEIEAWPVALGLAISPDGKRIVFAGGSTVSLFEFMADE